MGENTFHMSLIHSVRNMELFMRGRLHTPQSNGIAERKNRTLTDLVNAMLDTAGLSKEWWGEAILTACHVLNRVPTKNKEITPFEE